MTPEQASTRIVMSRAILTAWETRLPENENGHDAARAEAEITALSVIAVEHPHMAEKADRLVENWRAIMLALRRRAGPPGIF